LSAQSGATGGNGGSVIFHAANADVLTVDATAINVSSALNGNGGTIDLSAKSFAAFNTAQPIVLPAPGSGTGHGGSVAVTTTTTSDLIVGTAGGNFELFANSGGGGGSGGALSVISGGSLTVNSGGLDATGINGDGSKFTLTAGAFGSPSATLTLNDVSYLSQA